MSDENPSISLTIQIGELSPEIKNSIFVFFVLLVNINVFFLIINTKNAIKNVHNLIRFVLHNTKYRGYNVQFQTEFDAENDINTDQQVFLR